jgi:hypothetical protein
MTEPDFKEAAESFLAHCEEFDLDRTDVVSDLAQLLLETWQDSREAAGRCSDCGGPHPDPQLLLEHVHSTLLNGFAVTPDSPYPSQNVIPMLEAMNDYFGAHPVPVRVEPAVDHREG